MDIDRQNRTTVESKAFSLFFFSSFSLFSSHSEESNCKYARKYLALIQTRATV